MERCRQWLAGRSTWLLWGGLLLFLAAIHQVPRRLTAEDKQAFESYLSLLPEEERAALSAWKQAPSVDFEQELALLALLHRAIIRNNPMGDPIPQGQPRQPIDLYAFDRGGYCHDRAYTLAKLYRYHKWPTRQLAMFKRLEGQTAWQTLLTKKSRSHAVLEVKTSRGWLLIDPDTGWQALGALGQPYKATDLPQVGTAYRQAPPPDWYYTSQSIKVYGLYARHGRFFWPYNAFPDVNYGELLLNFV